MQRQRSLLPTGRKRVKLSFGGSFVITRFAVGQQLNPKDRDAGDQENMDETTLMEKKLENEPNHEKRTTDKPHLRETFPVNLGLSQNRLCKRAAVP
jgi:hypothetical protein